MVEVQVRPDSRMSLSDLGSLLFRRKPALTALTDELLLSPHPQPEHFGVPSFSMGLASSTEPENDGASVVTARQPAVASLNQVPSYQRLSLSGGSGRYNDLKSALRPSTSTSSCRYQRSVITSLFDEHAMVRVSQAGRASQAATTQLLARPCPHPAAGPGELDAEALEGQLALTKSIQKSMSQYMLRKERNAREATSLSALTELSATKSSTKNKRVLLDQ
ncbi:hypothetical protein CEUSTIGMA_g12929.t1 [Chlamydomonas eustigma]|uniref:Uncharacterized protein n=1 Tax=Chlamydomonas eustigma TaxID=1157962 RepID=A0A250XR69_9CHLO|nr:hypothetical protein CEUSTIGMA_g12929.t1 [Chlamydomonas eustigma]|eukprot:GAX85513.1 hypothetical protein CEUSTIGMA_g12929.t1 [Chlamydomonas eustigma]